MHEAPPDVADGAEHLRANSNTGYRQDTHRHVRKEAGEVWHQEKKTHSEDKRAKEKVYTVQSRNKAMKRIGLH